MLVLSRKTNEEIQIGDDIRIVVIEIRGDKARLGIAAPRDLVVDRGEVAMMRRDPEHAEQIRKMFKAGRPLPQIQKLLEAPARDSGHASKP